MTVAAPERSLVLAVHPTSRGFGWALFESPFKLLAFAVYTAPKDKNRGCLAKLSRLLLRYQPSTLVLEAFDRESTMRSERIRELCTKMIALAADEGLELTVYQRGQVEDAFAEAGARSRQEIAEAVARQLPAMQAHLPEPRRIWDSEDKRMAAFAACALALTYYRNEATALLDELRDAA